MDRRFPFDSQGRSGQNPLHNAQMRAALGLGQVDESLYLQQDIQRDLRLRQMLLAGQLDQRTRLGSLFQEQQLKAMDQFPELQHYQRLLMNDPYQQLHGEQASLHHLQQEELRRRALAQGATQLANASAIGAVATQPNLAMSPPAASKIPAGSIKDIAAEPLAGNAVKKDEGDTRVYAQSDIEDSKKRPRSNTAESTESNGNSKRTKNESESAEHGENDGKPPSTSQASFEDRSQPSAEALLQIAAAASRMPQYGHPGYPFTQFSPTPIVSPPPVSQTPKLGTLGDLLDAGQNVKKTDEAATALVGIKALTQWPDSDSEHEHDGGWEERQAKRKGDTIELPNFNSVLPQLPEEPKVSVLKDSSKKHKGILTEDSVDSKPRTKARSNSRTQEHGNLEADSGVVEYRFPIDTWWPSASSVQRERKTTGELPPSTRCEGSDEVLGKDSPFRIDVDRCRDVLTQAVTPGVLEKIPHCRIHRMNMMKKKNPMAPELCHCFQVTELYPNEHMLCCSVCGTWRHAACGGHHKPVSIRECMDKVFVPTCDRCHAEEKLLKDYPLARKRIDKQRTEQIRRGLATSAAMRQASFSKHGGTYKWPLGSVSATHIGGHTRSVHSRHDKAEKQWMDMATRLGSDAGGRPNHRVKHRTKELERLLVSVEDAEGHMDRHNMMLFLLQDTLRADPVGFEKHKRNIFDPADDEVSQSYMKNKLSNDDENLASEESNKVTDDDETDGDENSEDTDNGVCARNGCKTKRRFDSLFCSDSCGVSALEKDLLRTFQYASDFHPSLLRS
ncbi:unnamed protein product [Cylindrotheca closterium]|uniref:Uncharacterized protein n=1 Tax=Cylindrotheca closterium TaxID=2856 RepID=A0AAD2CDL2_9STRA|nr:unnamed protein product [Cylindrotheca closterium]